MPRIVGILSSIGPVRAGSSHGFRISVAGTLVELVARTLIEYDEAGWHYRGLRLVASAQADSIDHAASLFESAADSALGFLSGAAAAETGPMRFHLLYSQVAPGETGEMIVYGLEKHSDLKLHKAMWEHLEQLLLGVAGADTSTSQRIDRALRWYRVGVLEEDPVDRFAAFWIGLESLNPLLERKWGLEGGVRTCPHCGGELGKRHGLHGVEELLTQIPEGGKVVERRVRKLRNKLLHATADLRDNAAKAAELGNVLSVAVARGISRILDWPRDGEDRFARTPLPAPSPFGSMARFSFRRGDAGPLGCDGFHPFATLRTVEHVSHAEGGEPASVRYSARLEVVARPDFVVQQETLAAWVAGRVGDPLPVAEVELQQHCSAPPLPEARGKGVTLWEQGTDDVVWPGSAAAV